MGALIHGVASKNVFQKENFWKIPQKSVQNDKSRVRTYAAEANRYQDRFKSISLTTRTSCLEVGMGFEISDLLDMESCPILD